MFRRSKEPKIPVARLLKRPYAEIYTRGDVNPCYYDYRGRTTYSKPLTPGEVHLCTERCDYDHDFGM